MSGSRPVVGTAEALRDVLALARDLASERCEYGELPGCACHRCRSRRALAAWEERRPLAENAELRELLWDKHALRQGEGDLAWHVLSTIERALLGSPAPQGGRRG